MLLGREALVPKEGDLISISASCAARGLLRAVRARGPYNDVMHDLATLRSLFDGLDTASCCDADRAIRVLDPAIRPLQSAPRLLGLARPVVCRDDFLPVLRALADSRAGEVLMVDAGGSPRAVAGELFASDVHGGGPGAGRRRSFRAGIRRPIPDGPEHVVDDC